MITSFDSRTNSSGEEEEDAEDEHTTTINNVLKELQLENGRQSINDFSAEGLLLKKNIFPINMKWKVNL